MFWCEDCSRHWDPNSLGDVGDCPTCGTVIAKLAPTSTWHFKFLLVALTGYLLYRVYWLALWLPKHF